MIRMRVYKLEDNDLKSEVFLPTVEECQAWLDYHKSLKNYWIKDEKKILDESGNVVEVIPQTYRLEFKDVSYEHQLNECYKARRKAYPPLEELADAIVKDDVEALAEYKAKCLAVKIQYPKPEEPK